MTDAYQTYENFKVKVKAAMTMMDCMPTSFANNSTKNRMCYLFKQGGYNIRFTANGYTVIFGKGNNAVQSSGYSISNCIQEVIANYTG